MGARGVFRAFKKLIGKESINPKILIKLKKEFKNIEELTMIKKYIIHDLVYGKNPNIKDKPTVRKFKKERITITNENMSILGRLCYRYTYESELEFFRIPEYKFLFLELFPTLLNCCSSVRSTLSTLKVMKEFHYGL